jgi:phage replication O-like protein O
VANPQIENGYIRISNELFMAIIKSGFNASEIRVLLFILSQTFGYNKKSRRLSASYISMGAEIPISTVRKSVQKLIDKNVIKTSCEYNNSIKTISINKDYSKWRLPKNDYPKMGTHPWTVRLPKNGQSDYPSMGSNKRQTIKDRKEKTECVLNTPIFEDVLSYFIERDFSESAARDFFEYNDGRGWKNVVNWKPFADKWMRNDYGGGKEEQKVTRFGKEVERLERQ